ncbi:hypothetical protein H632_c2059p0 [Helicosporidium sp. ATCC 50920]|nr:hypothetical protein H632_c2059p0 [Helicosporidium sp. ATCC 50920]|eukprot:KDD73554.1 hypothetical protein H632_c2059p0 [Helicosporidium sp. ATCC 50920]
MSVAQVAKPGPKLLKGKVVSVGPAKTAVVAVTRLVQHPRYHKRLPRTKKFMAHDEEERAWLGDAVSIAACRPRSRRKHFELRDILQRPKNALPRDR